MKEIKVIKIKVICFGEVEVTWSDGVCKTLNLTKDLVKPLFKKINRTNFKAIKIIYDGCAIGWPEWDVEIGLSRWQKI
ncbi:MAG: hypothetical protein WCG27_02895 [Pseudomonadota bacterium]